MRFCLINLILVISAVAHAQTDTLLPGETLIRFNPTGIIDPMDLNISVGAERRITSTIAVGVDAAFIPYSRQMETAKKSRGFILRPAIRNYFGAMNFYVEAEGHFKQVTHHIEDWIDRGVVNDVGTYQEFTSFRYRKQTSGFNLKAGRIYRISQDRRLWLELYLGIGVHLRRFRLVNEPGSRYVHFNTFDELISEDVSTVPAIPAGLRFMYKL